MLPFTVQDIRVLRIWYGLWNTLCCTLPTRRSWIGYNSGSRPFLHDEIIEPLVLQSWMPQFLFHFTMQTLLPAPCFGKPMCVLYAVPLPKCSWIVISKRYDMASLVETTVALHTDPRMAYEAELGFPKHGAGNKLRIVKWNRNWGTRGLRSSFCRKGCESLGCKNRVRVENQMSL